MATNNIEGYIWIRLAGDQNPAHAEYLKLFVDSLTSEELTRATELYEERKQEINMRRNAPSDRNALK